MVIFLPSVNTERMYVLYKSVVYFTYDDCAIQPQYSKYNSIFTSTQLFTQRSSEFRCNKHCLGLFLTTSIYTYNF